MHTQEKKILLVGWGYILVSAFMLVGIAASVSILLFNPEITTESHYYWSSILSQFLASISALVGAILLLKRKHAGKVILIILSILFIFTMLMSGYDVIPNDKEFEIMATIGITLNTAPFIALLIILLSIKAPLQRSGAM